MLIDSHCHINFKEIATDLDVYMQHMVDNDVRYALCVATRPDNIAEVIDLADQKKNVFATVGIHPDEKLPEFELDEDFLFEYSQHPKVIAIGETGLDYYWNKDIDMSWQHKRFQTHIDVAKRSGLPLVIHTRESAEDAWKMLLENGIEECGAVIHCFTENLDWARKFLDLGCYISFSGIVTFKSAKDIQDAARYVPIDRLLVETDAPYLAPVPHRGKLNHPALVMHTAQFIADLRQTGFEEIAEATTNNFFSLFKKAKAYIHGGN